MVYKGRRNKGKGSLGFIRFDLFCFDPASYLALWVSAWIVLYIQYTLDGMHPYD